MFVLRACAPLRGLARDIRERQAQSGMSGRAPGSLLQYHSRAATPKRWSLLPSTFPHARPELGQRTWNFPDRKTGEQEINEINGGFQGDNAKEQNKTRKGNRWGLWS